MKTATFENIQQFYIEYQDVINPVPLVREISWSKARNYSQSLQRQQNNN